LEVMLWLSSAISDVMYLDPLLGVVRRQSDACVSSQQTHVFRSSQTTLPAGSLAPAILRAVRFCVDSGVTFFFGFQGGFATIRINFTRPSSCSCLHVSLILVHFFFPLWGLRPSSFPSQKILIRRVFSFFSFSSSLRLFFSFFLPSHLPLLRL